MKITILLCIFVILSNNSLYAIPNTGRLTDTTNKSYSADSIQYKNYDSYRLIFSGIGYAHSIFLHDSSTDNSPWGIELAYQHNHNIFTARLLADNIGVPVPYNNSAASVTEFGLLYGYGLFASDWQYSANVGIEYVLKSWPVSPQNPNIPSDLGHSTDSHCIGFPFQMNALYSISHYFGIGFIFFGDINPIYSHIGLDFCLQVGLL